MINKKEKKQEQPIVGKSKNNIESIIVFIFAVLFMSILSYAFLNLFIK